MHISVRRASRWTVVLLMIGLVVGVFASTAEARKNVERERLHGPIVTVVPVAYADNPAGVELMFAECAWLDRAVRADGSWTESQLCHLTGPFIEFPGEPPTEKFTNSAGECIWWSDYFANTTGENVFAEAVRLVVQPDGLVTVKTRYPAVPLDC